MPVTRANASAAADSRSALDASGALSVSTAPIAIWRIIARTVPIVETLNFAKIALGVVTVSGVSVCTRSSTTSSMNN